MYVKFTSTTSNKIDTCPIENGQVIALGDEPICYYDMNNIRYKISRLEFVSELPLSGVEDMLYICMNPEGMYTWSDSSNRFSIIYGVPDDGQNYVRRNNTWCRLNFVYQCQNKLIDGIGVYNIISAFNSSDIPSMSIKIIGTFGGNSLNFDVYQDHSLYLDFSDTSFPYDKITNLVIIEDLIGKVDIFGLHSYNIDNPIQCNGNGWLYVDNSNFYGDYNTGIIRHNGFTTISRCRFNLDNIQSAIDIHSPTLLSITGSQFTAFDASNLPDKVISIDAPFRANILINDNYIPEDRTFADNKLVDVKFTNTTY